MRAIPRQLQDRPFTQVQARQAGVSARMLMGKRFVRLFPRVYRYVEREMSFHDWIVAARLALPEDARLTGISRIQQAGCDYGPRWPLRFVVARDHHIVIKGVFLHRTVQMPPNDDEGVTLAAAYLAYCKRARVIDAIKVGDWLLRNGVTKADVRNLGLSQPWRDGAVEALWMLEHLDERSRSLPESEVRSILKFAGLEQPEVNRAIELEDGLVVTPDLLYRQSGVVVEYEGAQHQEDRRQYLGDLDRYAAYRCHGVPYVQVTKERVQHPQTLCGVIYRELVGAGYEGPPPVFGERWSMLFGSVSNAVGPPERRSRVQAV